MKTLLLIDEKPRDFKQLAEHLQAIGLRLTAPDTTIPVDEQVIRVRPHAVLLRKRNKTARERILSNGRVTDVPIVLVRAGRRHIWENLEQIQLALSDAGLQRLG